MRKRSPRAMTPHSNPVWGVITPHSTLKSWQVWCYELNLFLNLNYTPCNKVVGEGGMILESPRSLAIGICLWTQGWVNSGHSIVQVLDLMKLDPVIIFGWRVVCILIMLNVISFSCILFCMSLCLRTITAFLLEGGILVHSCSSVGSGRVLDF